MSAWLERRLTRAQGELGTYWLGLYEVFPERRRATRLAFAGPLPPCHEFEFDRGNVGTAAKNALTKVIPDVSADATYSQCFINVKSEAVVALPAPDTDIARSLRYYQPARGPLAWGVVDAESDLPNHFEAARMRRLEEFAQTLLPYVRFKPEHRALFEAIDDELQALVDARAHLKRESWSGIYLHAGTHLELGPYRGFVTDHHLIPIDRGLCGAAIRDNATVVVDDVRTSHSYLACSLETRSEIVIPIRNEAGQPVAELDLDSPHLGAYTDEDRASLEAWCLELPQKLKAKGFILT
ncbi:MAG: GAF domain-containing protein [Bdellovibrionales bacterium]|nr:GAF domain-containing protein [Bdellovibrionales bacterium]